ncbi:dienelactone hydrolase family protein [Bdellovibrionota bacterium FG-2]
MEPAQALPTASPVPPTPTASTPQCILSTAREIDLPIENETGEFAHAQWWSPATETPCAGIIFVSGVDGGFIEPADGIYTRMATQLSSQFSGGCVESIFVEYRSPGVLDPSVNDALAGAQFLRSHGVSKMAIVGWSFGGAVIVNSAVKIPEVTTVIGFSPQSRDTEAVVSFTNQSLLLFHSHDDENVPFSASLDILEEAPSTIFKEFHPLDGFDHQLTGAQDLVDPIVMQWLSQKLGLNSRPAAQPAPSPEIPTEIPITSETPYAVPTSTLLPVCAI